MGTFSGSTAGPGYEEQYNAMREHFVKNYLEYNTTEDIKVTLQDAKCAWIIANGKWSFRELRN